MSKATIWVRPSRGSFFFAMDKAKENPFDTFTGLLTGVYIGEDEYQGDKFKVIYLNFDTSQGEVAMSLRADTPYVMSFMGFLCNTNPEQEMDIIISEKNINGHIGSQMFVSQNGQYMKSFFVRGTETELPAWESTEFKGRKLWDRSKAMDKMIELVTNHLIPKIPNAGGGGREMPEFNPTEFGVGTPPVPVPNKPVEPESQELPTGKEEEQGLDNRNKTADLSKFKL